MNEIIKKNAIKYGIISGLIAILSTTIMYVIDYKHFVNIWIGLSLLLVYIIVGCYQLIELRKNLDGIMSFKDGFTGYFLGAMIGIAASTVFSIILFNFYDTETRDLITESLIKFQVDNLKSFNVPVEKIKEAVEQIKQTPQFSTIGLLKSFAGSLVGSIIFGLILAAIFKSKPQEQY
ncbi:DUF4199 domain-containing protein [Flavobacterium sp.]|uniref:DUF4199 domain-containing protein n=1 Tax=Flavobacterium sp. TaxID=239 RepID=UPI003F69940C